MGFLDENKNFVLPLDSFGGLQKALYAAERKEKGSNPTKKASYISKQKKGLSELCQINDSFLPRRGILFLGCSCRQERRNKLGLIFLPKSTTTKDFGERECERAPKGLVYLYTRIRTKNYSTKSLQEEGKQGSLFFILCICLHSRLHAWRCM